MVGHKRIPRKPLLWRVRRALLRPWWAVLVRLDCLLHRCDYYTHYLGYGPPELSHAAYHAACRRCIQANRRALDWYNDPRNEGRELPAAMELDCDRWERKVRA